MDSNIWLTIVTFLLVLVTGYYAWQTRKTLSQMGIQRRNSIKPHPEIIRFSFTYDFVRNFPPEVYQGVTCKTDMENLASSPCLNLVIKSETIIQIKYQGTDRQEFRKFTFILSKRRSKTYLESQPMEDEIVLFPEKNAPIVQPSNFGVVNFDLEYEDIDGNHFKETTDKQCTPQELTWILEPNVIPTWFPAFPEDIW